MGDHAPKLHGGRRAQPAPKGTTARRKKAEPTTPAAVAVEQPTPDAKPEQDTGES